MSYLKQTSIAGNTDDGFKCLIMHGHWNIESAIKRGRRSNIIGNMSITHQIFDMSGHGRGGHDGRYIVSTNNIYCRQSDWSEFGIEH